MKTLAIVGGTGIDELDGLEIITSHRVATPYGDPSRPIQEGRFGDVPVFYLQRHGSPAAIPPHRINYRANIWALHSLGVDGIVGVNAVGGIAAEVRHGGLVVPDQVIDYTWGREHTFDEGEDGSLLHIDFTQPYDTALRDSLVGAAQACGCAFAPTGVHGITQGPRLETAAEIQRMQRDGCDIVGMTGMPEAALARELGVPYAAVCMVVNAAAGLGDLPLTMETMRENIARESAAVRRLLQQLLSVRDGG